MNEDGIKKYEKLIWKIAGFFYGIDKYDLYQAGVVGLLKAYQNYNKESVAKFSSYAHDYIFGEMYLLASNRKFKISKDILKLYKKIELARYNIAQKINKVPSNLELSEYLGLSLYDIDMATLSAKAVMSLDTYGEDEKDCYQYLGKSMDMDTQILIDDSFKVLNNEERKIIKSRYFEDLTQSEVAKKLNMTQVMVSRYEKKSLEKMRTYLQT